MVFYRTIVTGAINVCAEDKIKLIEFIKLLSQRERDFDTTIRIVVANVPLLPACWKPLPIPGTQPEIPDYPTTH
jgi:hypothetical protein